MQSVTGEERALLVRVKSVEDVIAVQGQYSSVGSLRLESAALSDAFVASNLNYICDVLGIPLNDAKKRDLLDEVGQVSWLTMADFKLFLDRMKKHKFFRKDYQELISEFWKYCDDRLEVGAMISGGEVDSTDSYKRSGEVNHIRDLNIFKIKNENTFDRGVE